MRGNYPLTRKKLHAALIELLEHPEVRLRYSTMTAQQGHSLWDDITPPTNIVLRVDANRAPLDHLSTVIHELAHVVLRTMFVGFVADDLEEVMVLAIERDLYDYVKRSRQRLERWNEAIKSKLPEGE